MLSISRSISKGKQLSEFEKEQIDILKRQGLNLCQIFGIIDQSRCVCRNYIKIIEMWSKQHESKKIKAIPEDKESYLSWGFQ